MAERDYVLGRAERQLFKRSAVSSPSPRSGEVKRTSLPDTFDGIRFEIGRMVQYVRDAVNDPAVRRKSAEIQGRSPGLGTADTRALGLRTIDEWCREHFRYVNDPPNVEVIQTPGRMVKQTEVPSEVLEYMIAPFYDAFSRAGFNVSGYVPPPSYVGDCVPFSQKVIVQDDRGAYKIVPIGALKDLWRTHWAMSWNERAKKAEPRKILAFLDKGTLPVYQVRLSNGLTFRCTKNHELYVLWKRDQVSSWSLVTMTLEELMARRAKLRTHERMALPVVQEIPEAADRAVPDVPVEQVWVEGLYVAEGWRERSSPKYSWRVRIGMNNPEAIAELKECLDSIGQPYGETKRKSDGLVTVGLHVSPFVTRLAEEFGELSVSRRFPEAYLSMDRERMMAALDAFATGDGYYPKSGQWARNANLVYNTQSEVLARQIAFMHLVLGRPLSFYRQPAWKTKPVMYRLYEYNGTHRTKLDGLVGSRIASIEPDEPERCCDITVEGNHNFLLEGGVLVHNCDEGVTAMTGLAAATFGRGGAGMNGRGSPDVRYFFQFGGNEGTLHHVWSKTLLDGVEYHADHTEPGYKLGDHSPFEAYEDVEVEL